MLKVSQIFFSQRFIPCLPILPNYFGPFEKEGTIFFNSVKHQVDINFMLG